MGFRITLSPRRARPAAHDRNPVGGSWFARAAAVCALSFLALLATPLCPTLLAQETSDDGETPRLRLGEGVAVASDPYAIVPVYTRYADASDGVQVTLEFDRSRLRFDSILTPNDAWQAQAAVVHADGLVTIDLRFYGRLDADLRGTDTEAVRLRFALLAPPNVAGGAAAGDDPLEEPDQEPFRRRFKLDIVNGDALRGSYFYLRPAETRHAIQGRFEGGDLVVYYRSGFELGWGALSNVESAFSLPLYLTFVGDVPPTTLATGIDYDELFLHCTGVDGLAPPLVSTQVELEPNAEASGARVRMDLHLAPDAIDGSVVRLQVATLHFRYQGGLSGGDELIIAPILLAIDGEPVARPEADGEGGEGGQALGLGSNAEGLGSPGVVRFLPTYFVRGNVDSSHQRQPDGSVTYLPDVSDVIRILTSRFMGGGALPCSQAADANASGSVEVTDAILFLNHLFGNAAPPRPPFPDPGFAFEDEPDLGCDQPIPHFESVPTEY